MATLTETHVASVKTFDSHKRDSRGELVATWREEARSTFTLNLSSEAAGSIDKLYTVPLTCQTFHELVTVPLTIQASDTTRPGSNWNGIQAPIVEVLFRLSLPSEARGYKCTIQNISQCFARRQIPGPAAPPRNPQPAPNPNPQAMFGFHIAAQAPQIQTTTIQCSAAENGEWKVVGPPGQQAAFSVVVVLSSPKSRQAPVMQPMSKMLKGAQETGDVEIQSEDGTVTFAHAAVLNKVPYFNKHFSDTWASERWNLHHKLKCQLPCRNHSKSVAAFLQFVYGNKHAVYDQDAVTLQELFSLGEACELISLCHDVANVTQIDSESLLSWITWLKGEHVKPAVDVIANKVIAHVRQLMQAKEWANVSAEALENVVLALQLVQT